MSQLFTWEGFAYNLGAEFLPFAFVLSLEVCSQHEEHKKEQPKLKIVETRSRLSVTHLVKLTLEAISSLVTSGFSFALFILWLKLDPRNKRQYLFVLKIELMVWISLAIHCHFLNFWLISNKPNRNTAPLQNQNVCNTITLKVVKVLTNIKGKLTEKLERTPRGFDAKLLWWSMLPVIGIAGSNMLTSLIYITFPRNERPFRTDSFYIITAVMAFVNIFQLWFQYHFLTRLLMTKVQHIIDKGRIWFVVSVFAFIVGNIFIGLYNLFQFNNIGGVRLPASSFGPQPVWIVLAIIWYPTSIFFRFVLNIVTYFYNDIEIV